MYFSGGRDGEVCMCELGGVGWGGVEWRLVWETGGGGGGGRLGGGGGRDCRLGCWCDRGHDVISLIR